VDRVLIFDTTLRDGEQAPGFSMNTGEKLEMARQLARLNVDVIEAGFPISSDEDFEATREVARQVGALEGAPIICGLSRVGLMDIDRCWEAVKYARRPRIHTFVATSDIHLKYKLRKSRAEVLKAAVEAVKHARAYCGDVEFSPEDASRSDFDYMCDVLEAVIDAGAGTINIPDTVGYAIPEEWAQRIARIRERVRNSAKAVISVHCHNDLGQAVANSVAAIRVGARQVECAVNGIGERAGNASLEEIVMALHTRKDFFGVETGCAPRRSSRPRVCSPTSPGCTCSPTRPSWARTPSPTRRASTRTGCSRRSSPTRSCGPRTSGAPPTSS
jgi:2-isopropylmalate synthase